MKNKVKLLKSLGNKMASISVEPRCYPLWAYQPKPPAKIQAKMLESK